MNHTLVKLGEIALSRTLVQSARFTTDECV